MVWCFNVSRSSVDVCVKKDRVATYAPGFKMRFRRVAMLVDERKIRDLWRQSRSFETAQVSCRAVLYDGTGVSCHAPVPLPDVIKRHQPHPHYLYKVGFNVHPILSARK